MMMGTSWSRAQDGFAACTLEAKHQETKKQSGARDEEEFDDDDALCGCHVIRQGIWQAQLDHGIVGVSIDVQVNGSALHGLFAMHTTDGDEVGQWNGNGFGEG